MVFAISLFIRPILTSKGVHHEIYLKLLIPAVNVFFACALSCISIRGAKIEYCIINRLRDGIHPKNLARDVKSKRFLCVAFIINIMRIAKMFQV